MERLYFSLTSNYDSLNISTCVITCPNPHAIVQFVHGMCEHKERYYHFMEYLAQHGFACIIHDNRGHGKSVKDNNDLGYFYESKNIGYVEDIKLVQDYIKFLFPNKPLILFGHSMGSLGVRAFTKKYDSCIDYLIVCGSPSYNTFAPIGIFIIKSLIHIKGDSYKDLRMHDLIVGSFEKPFKNEKRPNAWICSDVNVVNKYNKNPLCQFVFTLNGCLTLLLLINDVYSTKKWVVTNPSLPIHFISGKDDPCRINDQKFMQAVNLMKKVGYQNVTYHLYNNMRHEILNEKDKEIVYKDILELIQKRTNC